MNLHELERHEHERVFGVERIHQLWVVGPRGAVSTWFSDAKAALGHSVCNGAALHSSRPLEGFDEAVCDFIGKCWFQPGSMLWIEPIVKAYDAGDIEAVWSWLGAHYESLEHPGGDQ